MPGALAKKSQSRLGFLAGGWKRDRALRGSRLEEADSREIRPQAIQILEVGREHTVSEPDERTAVQGYSSHSAWIAASSLGVIAPFSFS